MILAQTTEMPFPVLPQKKGVRRPATGGHLGNYQGDRTMLPSKTVPVCLLHADSHAPTTMDFTKDRARILTIWRWIGGSRHPPDESIIFVQPHVSWATGCT
jgi:hypothetical protein